MKEIIKLILKYHFTIIFILLEIVSFSLIIRHNEYQRAIFSESASTLFGNVSASITSINDYFRLKEMNESLANENILLKNCKIINNRYAHLVFLNMKKLIDFTVTENKRLNHDTILLVLHSDELPEIQPGQFVNVRVDHSPSTFLRRPISVHDVDESRG